MWPHTPAASQAARVAICLWLLANPARAQGGSWSAPIDPAVVAELDAGRVATFWVVLGEQADLDAFAAVSLLLVDGFESGDPGFWSAVVP